MSEKDYEKECTYCHDKIRMSKETGKWLPYNKDGSAHDCRNEATSNEINVAKQEANKLYDDMIKRLQSVITDLEDLKRAST